MAVNGVLKVHTRAFLSYNCYAFLKSSSVASFSTAFERAKGSNTAVESTGTNSGAPDPTREGKNEANQEALDVHEGRSSGLRGYAAEKLKDGAEVAKDVTDRIGETAKRTMDGAWKGSVEAMEQMKKVVGGDEEEEKRGSNYRMDVREDRERTIDDLRRRAEGYDVRK